MDELKSIRQILKEVAAPDPELAARFQSWCDHLDKQHHKGKKPPQRAEPEDELRRSGTEK